MVQIGSCGSFRHSEHGADLGVPIALDVVKDEYRALPRRQLGKCFAQSRLQLRALRRIAKGQCCVRGNFLCDTNFPPAHQVERGVRDDPREPRTERIRGVEAAERAVRMKERILERVFSILVLDRDRSGNSARRRGSGSRSARWSARATP